MFVTVDKYKAMRVSFYSVLLIFIIGSILSCNPRGDASLLLEKARDLAEDQPDSAIRLIDSIFDPEGSLNKEQYMQYLVTYVQVKHKNYRDIRQDTLIFEATEYFTARNKDPRQIALAQFYSGSICRSQRRYDLAMEYYKEAEHYAEKSGDASLQGLVEYNIGDLLAEQGLHFQALDRYKAAARYYQAESDKQAYSYTAMGRMFLFENETDSAFYYFHLGLDLAEEMHDRPLQDALTQSLSVAYRELGEYVTAEKYLRQSRSLNVDSNNLPRYYLNFAKLYEKTSQTDSIKRYVQKLKESMNKLPDNYFQVSALNFLADWEKTQRNYDSAFAHQETRMKVLAQIMEDRENQSVYDVEQKYNYERMQTQHYRTQSARQQWIIVLLAVIIVGGASFVWYWIRQKNRRIQIQQNVNTLTEMNRDLERLVQRKQTDLRKELLWRFDVAKKVIKLNEEVDNGEKNKPKQNILMARFNHIVYGETTIDEQWEVLLQTFKKARPGYVESIKSKHPDLTETEFRICILTYADFAVKEIAVVLQQSPHTIQTRRTTLRKKLGVSAGGNIAAHIDNKLG